MDLPIGHGRWRPPTQFSAAHLETAVVILTTFAEPEQVLRSLDAGAVGYLMKDADPQTLADGIRAAAAGDRRSTPGSRAQCSRRAGPAAFRRLRT